MFIFREPPLPTLHRLVSQSVVSSSPVQRAFRKRDSLDRSYVGDGPKLGRTFWEQHIQRIAWNHLLESCEPKHFPLQELPVLPNTLEKPGCS